MTNSVVCGASKGCIYKQIKPPLVGEHAFPLTGFVCWSAHVTLFMKNSGIVMKMRSSSPANRPVKRIYMHVKKKKDGYLQPAVNGYFQKKVVFISRSIK